MTWTMTAILTRCRIVSLRPRSGRLPFSSRSKDFNLNRRPLRRTPHSRSPTGRLTSPSARETTAGALRPGRIVSRATDFRTEVRDPIALTKTATMGIATIDIRRDGRPRDFRPYRDPQQPREAVPDAAAAPGLPSFITASPRINNPDPAMGAPSPETVASPPPVVTPEVAPEGFESPPEGSAFPARGRRRRLRSPYGFGGANSGEGDQPDATPEIADDTPVRE